MGTRARARGSSVELRAAEPLNNGAARAQQRARIERWNSYSRNGEPMMKVSLAPSPPRLDTAPAQKRPLEETMPVLND